MALSAYYTNDTVDSLAVGVTGLLLFPVVLVILLLMIFVYKTYKTTFQRLILYYVILGLWTVFSYALQILGGLNFNDEKTVCAFIKYLHFGSIITWYIYVVAITNFSLLLVPYLIQGRPVSKRSSRVVECVCVLLTIITALVVTIVMQVKYVSVLCTNPTLAVVRQSLICSVSIIFGVSLEVVLVSLSLSAIVCFIRQRIHTRQTVPLLKKAIYHLGINTFLMAVYCSGAAYKIYALHRTDSLEYLNLIGVLIWDVVVILAVGISVIIQAVMCIQTSTEKSFYCKTSHSHDQFYAVIDGKDTATNPASSRISQPSHTTFAVSYTGAFTQITVSINNNGKKLVLE